MSRKSNTYSQLFNIIFPLLMIAVGIFLVVNVLNYLEDIRENSAREFMSIIEMSVANSQQGDGLNPSTIEIVSAICQMRNKIAVIYDANLNTVLTGGVECWDIFDFEGYHTQLGGMILAYEYGHMQKVIRTINIDIFFQWLYDACGTRYLLVYGIDTERYNLALFFVLVHVIIAMTLIFALKVIFIDHMLAMRTLQTHQSERIESFKENKYD